MTITNVCFIGLGYVGLPTAALLASKGVHVHGCDINPKAVELINKGEAHIEETDLAELISSTVADGKLKASISPAPADIFVIAVPTPFNDDKTPDLTYVLEAGKAIAPHLVAGNLVILESTSPVGATERLRDTIAAVRPDLTMGSNGNDIEFAYCPERILPGNTIHELVHNSRSIGGMTPAAASRAAELYRVFCTAELVETTARAAEMTKLVENSFRDVNIAFANELSVICDTQGIDVHEVVALANRHPRVNVLTPGVGVGGHCIPVDPWFIVAGNPEESKLIKQARLTNDDKPRYMAQRLITLARATGAHTCLVLGLTYKPDVDDFRESPSFDVLNALTGAGLTILAHDPYMDKYTNALPAGVNIADDAHVAINAAGTVTLLATPHSVYSTLTPTHSNMLLDPAGFLTHKK